MISIKYDLPPPSYARFHLSPPFLSFTFSRLLLLRSSSSSSLVRCSVTPAG